MSDAKGALTYTHTQCTETQLYNDTVGTDGVKEDDGRTNSTDHFGKCYICWLNCSVIHIYTYFYHLL